MMIEKRPALLLNYFLTVKHTTMNQMMTATNLTKRQISYDLDKVNQWLKDKDLPVIHYKGSQTIEVPELVLEYLQKQQTNFKVRDLILTEEERVAVIYLYLFIRTEAISSIHLTQLLQVSKNTVISDVKRANGLNRRFLVEIYYTRQRGYHLNGNEFDKRVLAIHCLSKLIQVPYFESLMNHLLQEKSMHLHYENIHRTLKQLEKQHNLHFVEERLYQFTYFLMFYSFRLQERKYAQFHTDEMNLLKQDPMWQVAGQLGRSLLTEKEEAELTYLTIQLLGLSLGRSSTKENGKDILFKLCEQLVFDFESKACIVFEKKDEVIQTLYQHVKPAYFRMKYRIPIDNPLLNQIKSEHIELFIIVKEVLHPIGSLLGITIPEEEIGFITIHFGALLNKPTQAMPKKKQAIVVCPSGISSSLMVKHQLESLFSEIIVKKTVSLQEFKENSFVKYDLIFSTVKLETNLPCFYVKPIMTPIEKNNLVSEVYQYLFGIQYQDISPRELLQEIGKYAHIIDENGLKQMLSQITFHKKVDDSRGRQPVLQDLLKNETIQVIDELSDWEEAVKIAANPLLLKGIIEPSYIKAMIENIKTLGPYVVIGPEVAIPHARPEMGVNQVGMSFLKLNQPVNFLNNEKYPVRLLFCIAAVDNTMHLKALSQLTKLLSDKTNIEHLKQLDSTEEMIELFQQYSEVV